MQIKTKDGKFVITHRNSLVSLTRGSGPPLVVVNGWDPLPPVIQLLSVTRFVELFGNRLNEVPDIILVVDSWPFLLQVTLHCWRSVD